MGPPFLQPCSGWKMAMFSFISGDKSGPSLISVSEAHSENGYHNRAVRESKQRSSYSWLWVRQFWAQAKAALELSAEASP